MIALGICDQAGCRIAQEGQCMEGLSISGWNKCPHFTPLEDDSEEKISLTDSNEQDVLENEDDVQFNGEENIDDLGEGQTAFTNVLVHTLATGEELDMQGVSDIIRAGPTRLIILAGDSDSGKTTLLSCLNECFQRGSYAGYLFARSQTLVAFERICHESRLASKRSEPDTARTMINNGPRFLHLAVRHEDRMGPRRHILLSNIAGEDFERARNFKDEALAMDFIRYADHFVLVLDGSRLARPESRTKARSHARQTLRRLIEVGILGNHSQVDILTSKWDCLQRALSSEDTTVEEKNVLKDFLEDTQEAFREEFESLLGRLRFFEVAARPDLTSDIPDGYGLEAVFGSWVEDTVPLLSRSSTTHAQRSTEISSLRQSARFVWQPTSRL